MQRVNQFDFLKIKTVCASRAFSNYTIKKQKQKKNIYKKSKRQILNIFTVKKRGHGGATGVLAKF